MWIGVRLLKLGFIVENFSWYGRRLCLLVRKIVGVDWKNWFLKLFVILNELGLIGFK